jgi:hypothetical protein
VSDRSDKLKSMGKSFLASIATSAYEVLGRDAALNTLKIDLQANDYKEVTGKLAYAIVELQEEVVRLRTEIAVLRHEAGSR